LVVPTSDDRATSPAPTGICGFGVYLPRWRLDRAAIDAALGTGGVAGRRAVSGPDEDTSTMAVEACRRALAAGSEPIELLVLSTPAPVFTDRTNATTVHAGLGLRPDAACGDCCGSVRSGWVATMAAWAAGGGPATESGRGSAVAVVADQRTGLPGSGEERVAGDAAGALVFGAEPVAELLGRAASSDELLDRWRVPGEATSHLWEERFAEEVLAPLAADALRRACQAAGFEPAGLDRLVVGGLAERANRAALAALRLDSVEVCTGWVGLVGNLGAAQAVIGLVDALERARPGETIGVLQVADGADAAIWRVTDRLPGYLERRRTHGLAAVAELLAEPHLEVSYPDFLAWRGLLVREPPRRPEPELPGAPVSHRAAAWKYGFVGSRCRSCGFRHLPPTRICLRCRAVDAMVPDPVADAGGTLAAFAVDRLAASLGSPVVGGIVDVAGGGRFRGQLTDVDPATLAIGQRVELVFRRLSVSRGVPNYFWKARPRGPASPASKGADDVE
jgi:3-hydroxy-3-methylglutaryl CoA synthase/uncharacterized OB-fold protein